MMQNENEKVALSSRVQIWWRGWKSFLDEKESGTVLAVFRAAVGFIVLITLAYIIHSEVAEIIWTDKSAGGYRRIKGNHIINLFGGPTFEVVHAFIWAGVISSVMVMVGLGGRLSILICLQVYMGLHRLNGEASGSSDIVITNALWILFLAGPTKTFSLDCLIKTRKWFADTLVSSWPRYLIVFQLVWMYSTTGWQKISSHWMPGGGFTALHYIFQQPNWARFDNDWLLQFDLLTRAFTATTWLWECTSIGLLLWYFYQFAPAHKGRLRRWVTRFDLRIPFAIIGLGFHISIMLLMVVGPFSPISMTFYICVFHPSEYGKFFRWLKIRAYWKLGDTD
jgi:hypothetical protein